MNTVVKYFFKKGILFLGVMQLSLGWSQKLSTQTFTDPHGVKGQVVYTGSLTDSLLPKEGPYQLHWRVVEGVNVKTYRVNGTVVNHLPHGKWQWEEGMWDYKIETGNTLEPVFKTAGTKRMWAGSFQKGVPYGKWSFSIDSVGSNGRVIRSFFKAEWESVKGKITGKVRIEDKRHGQDFLVDGSCDEEGVAEGTWKFIYFDEEGNKVTEEHLYRKGIILSVALKVNETVVKREFETNQNFFKGALTVLATIGSDAFTESEHSADWGEKYQEYVREIFFDGWQLEIFPFSYNRLFPEFKRLTFPLTKNEEERIHVIREKSMQIQNKILPFLKDDIFMQRARGEELDAGMSYLLETQKRMKVVDSLMARTRQHDFPYKKRYHEGVAHWIAKLNEKLIIKGEIYETHIMKLPRISYQSSETTFFEELNHLLDETLRALPDVLKVVERERRALEREGELKQLEQVLSSQYEKLAAFYGEEQGLGRLLYEKWIKKDIESGIREFAQTDEYEQAKIIGEAIRVKMDSLESWKADLKKYDAMSESLESGFTFMVYNPYTGQNDIPMIVKRRLLNTVNQYVLPWFYESYRNEGNWDEWVVLWKRQGELFEFMIEFARREDKQAKKINRRARKEKKPERFLKIIGV